MLNTRPRYCGLDASCLVPKMKTKFAIISQRVAWLARRFAWVSRTIRANARNDETERRPETPSYHIFLEITDSIGSSESHSVILDRWPSVSPSFPPLSFLFFTSRSQRLVCLNVAKINTLLSHLLLQKWFVEEHVAFGKHLRRSISRVISLPNQSRARSSEHNLLICLISLHDIKRGACYVKSYRLR